ncbi:DUF2239 family protein [Phyllobacterium sp. BT25]|uniref:DUF2239 family protein n=1 Tax=Phyllobacterium pellucidum TaxID=2740464 RepID=A0A849VQQ7_9HYPH|nr:DUF2239 family protein [Phyllobacterium pellucidum]NTS31049.1 DUF2239 family protein [Phyllobacterium pellucidum]
MENAQETYTAFKGVEKIASGAAAEVALKAKGAGSDDAAVLIFEDSTGRQVDFDLSGTEAEIVARLDPTTQRGPGRPKLGVTAREVTLLPRQWEWLARQPGGASVTLRKLVDAARNSTSARERKRLAQEAADRFMMAMAGDLPHYEEAARALYAGDYPRFAEHTESWPQDVRNHARRLSDAAFDRTDFPA